MLFNFAFVLFYSQLATCIISTHLIPRNLSETSSNTTLSSSSSPPTSLATSSTRSCPLTTEAFSEIPSATVTSASSFDTQIHATSGPSSSLSSRSSTPFSTTRHSLLSEASTFTTSSSIRGHSLTPVGSSSVSSVAIASANNTTPPNPSSTRISSRLISNESSIYEPKSSIASKGTSKNPSSLTHKSDILLESQGSSSSSHVSSKLISSTVSTSKSSKGTPKKKSTTHISVTGWNDWSSTRIWTCTGIDKVRIYTTHDDWCRISVNTVQLHYWPTGTITDGLKYPATRILSYPNKNVTMVSPSIYYVIDSMFVVNPCAQPITSRGTLINFIASYRLEQVSTKQPYKNGAKSRKGVRIGPDKQLELSDLRTDCPTTKATPPKRNFVVESNYNGACEPLLVWRDDLMTLRNKEVDWSNCGRVFGGNFGLFDPPMPVAPCTVGDCANQGAENAGLRPSPPTTPAVSQGTTLAIASPAQALPTSGPTATTNPVVSPQNPGINNSPSPVNLSNIPAETNQPVTVIIPLDNTYATNPSQPQGPAAPSTPLNGAAVAAPNNRPAPTPILIATLGNGDVVSASQGASSVVVGSETISAGSPAITIPNVGVVSLLPSGGGMVVNNNEAVTTYTYGNNTVPAESPKAVPIGTLAGGSVISAFPAASTLVIGTQTLSLNGPAVTLPGQGIMSLSPTGLVISNDGKSSTSTIPTVAPNPGKLLTLPFGQVITAIPGASSLMIGTQILTVNGPALTIPGQGTMSLSPTGIVVINSGTTTTWLRSQASHTPHPIPNTVFMNNGEPLTISPLGSLVAIGGKTLTQGGSIATLPGDKVVSLGSSVVVVQMPGGKVMTILVSGVVSKTVLPQSALVSSTTGFGTSTKTSVVGGGVLVETATVGVPATSSSLGENTSSVISAKKGGSVGLRAKVWGSCLFSGVSVVLMLFL